MASLCGSILVAPFCVGNPRYPFTTCTIHLALVQICPCHLRLAGGFIHRLVWTHWCGSCMLLQNSCPPPMHHSSCQWFIIRSFIMQRQPISLHPMAHLHMHERHFCLSSTLLYWHLWLCMVFRFQCG